MQIKTRERYILMDGSEALSINSFTPEEFEQAQSEAREDTDSNLNWVKVEDSKIAKAFDDFVDTLQLTEAGTLINPPTTIPSDLLLYRGTNPLSRAKTKQLDFRGFPHQICLGFSAKEHCQRREGYKAKKQQQDLWFIYTGSIYYWYSSDGNLLTETQRQI